jgi:hypothetical protein
MANAGRNEDTTYPQPAVAESNLKTHAGEEIARLRQEVSALSRKLRQISGPERVPLKRASYAASEMMSGVNAKGREAVEGVQEVKDKFMGAIDASLKNRAYTTLAMAFGVGFLLGRLT